MVHSPLPKELQSELRKCVSILRDFTIPSASSGPDGVIPRDIVRHARGIAVMSVFKLGFLITARGGSGLVVARLPDGAWSAPSAIGIAGIGGGLEVGIESTDFVFILNSDVAVESFARNNVSLGGNLTVAIGPLGRNMEADVCARRPAAIYTYSKSKGLFAGISVEGAAIIERKDTNRRFYEVDVTAMQLLKGEIDQPPEADQLYHALAELDNLPQVGSKDTGNMADSSVSARGSRSPPKASTSRSKASSKWDSSATASVSSPRDSSVQEPHRGPPAASAPAPTSTWRPFAAAGNASTTPRTAEPKVLQRPTGRRCRCVYQFDGQETGDLSIKPDDVITISATQDLAQAWWRGTLNGRSGIFPANYVQLL